ncbi:MAG TPA: efflux RND transporter periplasmic adaptor subunit [Thermoanaerobaculia bacterium]|nr:efflux RND transporter periplasmic adaptor subunit [Thermoanaerobaculia bacterium]
MARPFPWRRRAPSHCFLLLATCLLPLTGCSDPDAVAAEGEGAGERLPTVEAVLARRGSLPREDTLSGVVRARNQVAIRPEIEATVVSVLARSGDTVEVGQPLVRLQDDRLREQLRQAEASLMLAQAQAAEARAEVAEVEAQAVRTRALAQENLVSGLERDTQEARLEAARARASQAVAGVAQAQATLQERRTALGKTVVRAPVPGRVGQRNAEVGMLVDPSTTLFLLGGLEELIVEVPLTEGMLDRIREGTPVAIAAAGLAGRTLRGAISRISPFLEQETFSTLAEIDVDNPGGLRPGMFVTVEVLYGESDSGTLVPVSSLWEHPGTGRDGVFVIEQTAGLEEPQRPAAEIPEEPRRVAFRLVEVRAQGRGIAGVGGLEEGEWVVTLGQHLLQDPASQDTPTRQARVRATTWDHVLGLQDLQREDLLRDFLDKQQQVSRALGTEIPESEAAVDEVLARPTADGS